MIGYMSLKAIIRMLMCCLLVVFDKSLRIPPLMCHSAAELLCIVIQVLLLCTC